MTDQIGRREFLKRGTAAGLLATAVPMPAIDMPPAHHASTATRHLDSRDFCLAEYDAISPSLPFTAVDPVSARRWQLEARRRLIDRLGGFPAQRSPLNAEVVERLDFGTYTREKVTFDTRANLSAIGYLLLPKAGARPLPAVVCLSGHGRGLPDILGMADDGSQRAERGVGYAKEYAVQCVEQGFATFAVEQLGFGSRRDSAARARGPSENSCRPAACAALLFGQTMAGWRVWDVMRAIDYLEMRPEIDAARIATLGASGGGTTSLLAAATDERVKLAVVSAYFNTFRDSIVSISHCPDNYVPGLVRDMEMYDLAGLVAPRALFVESGRRDTIFPREGFDVAVRNAERIYRAFGTSERMGHRLHDGGHEFHGVDAFAFARRLLLRGGA